MLRWSSHDEERQHDLAALLPLVRWPMIDGVALADLEDEEPRLATAASTEQLSPLLLEAFKFQAATPSRRVQMQQAAADETARRFRPRTPNMVRLQGEGKFCWTLKNFSKLSAEERVYSPPFTYGGIAFMLLLFPRGNQQREFASLYVSIADKTKLPAGWRRNVHFSLSVLDQKESLCSITKSTNGELSNQVLDWGFTELLPLSTLHSTNHGYILDETLQFTVQFERIYEGDCTRGKGGDSHSPSGGMAHN